MNNFLANREKSLKELFEKFPQLAKKSKLDLANLKGEHEVHRHIKSLAEKNNSDYISFLGAGVYNKFIPSEIYQFIDQYDFLTFSKSHQEEFLQIMNEYQATICSLTGMDIATTSIYDVATACAEAILIATKIAKNNKVLVGATLNPECLKVIMTYAWANELELEMFQDFPTETDGYACVIVQNPDYFGELLELKKSQALLIVVSDISSLAILEPPTFADIVVGNLQPLGIPISFGGAYLGFIACKEAYKQDLLSRYECKNIKTNENSDFVSAIQAENGHILLYSALYLSLMGEKRFKQASYIASKNAHILAEKLRKKGIKIETNTFYNEFVIEVEYSDEFLDKLKKNNILGGLKLDEKRILVCSTEMISKEDIDLYISSI